MTKEQIYEALEPYWWQNGYTMVYFLTKDGEYGDYPSYGFNTSDEYIDYLRQDTANYLYISGCTGGITNIKPKVFDPKPIYFK